MSLAETLLPLAVLVPLGVGAVLLALAHVLPRRVADVSAILAALAVGAICLFVAHAALEGPVAHWFGGWTPEASGRPGVAIGIGFLADPASASVAAFCALVFLASFVFSFGGFDREHAHFHVLMLMFMGAMTGFALTNDLFNLFVWFELMSIAAFALTAYPLGESSLEGALNFTVTNSLASFAMLAGIGLIYVRTGALDFAAMRAGLGPIAQDPVLAGGFCLLAAALLTKAAIVPFHLWLSDAHAVAPSPVSTIFSGAMVSLGLFALVKIALQVFPDDAQVTGVIRHVLVWFGAATALVGALMAWTQRHVKRLLAFSTISHLGIMLAGGASLSGTGTTGFLIYLFGHGLVKAALFMTAGILLSLRSSADEIALYGKGRGLRPAGLAMAFGALMLGGLPLGLMHGASHYLHEAAGSATIDAVIVVATGLTGAAVLRAALRIFWGLSGVPGIEAFAPTERESERANRPLWLMLLPCVVLLALSLVPADWASGFAARAAAGLVSPDAPAEIVLPGAGSPLLSLAPAALMMVLVALSLLGRRPVRPLARRLAAAGRVPLHRLGEMHSGLVGDYVTFMVLGFAILALAVGLF